MQNFRVAMSKVICGHVLDCQVLMITARTAGGPAHLEKIEEMDRELTKVIEDFNHAVDVEALRLVKKSGEYSLSLPEIIHTEYSV